MKLSDNILSNKINPCKIGDLHTDKNFSKTAESFIIVSYL